MQSSLVENLTWKLKATDDGIQVCDSILWLDACHTEGLTFLSSASVLHERTNSQVIATEETIKILALNNIKLNALTCSYNQIVSIGQLRLELLPSGEALGAASLWIQQKGRSLLYAPMLQPQKNGVSRAMQLKEAQTLILGAPTPLPQTQGTSRKKEKDRLIQAIISELKLGNFPLIYCEPASIAQELCKLLSDHDIPVSVPKSIFRLNQIHKLFGSDLGRYSLLHKKSKEQNVVILPSYLSFSETLKQRFSFPNNIVFSVQDHSFHDSNFAYFPQQVKDRFYFNSSCNIKDLRTIIQTVGSSHILIFGPYAKQYVQELSHSKLVAWTLQPHHLPSLF